MVGKTPNLAARLQALAEPNAVVIAEGTRKLLGEIFELGRPWGLRTSKASPGLCGLGRRCAASSLASRFDALHTTGLTALVGRGEEEFELLLRRWSTARRRVKARSYSSPVRPASASLYSRRALLERLASEPHTRLRYFCSPQHSDSALYPIIGQMERTAGLAYDDAPQAKLDKLDAVLAQTRPRPRIPHYWPRCCRSASDGRYPVFGADPGTTQAKNAGRAGVATSRGWLASSRS